jgi:hypothetical protein
MTLLCSIPSWLSDALALVSTVLLAIPAWRIDRQLRRIKDARTPTPGAPMPKLEGLSRRWATRIQATIDEWNRTNSLLFRAGIVLAIFAGLVALANAATTNELKERCVATDSDRR